MDHPVASAVVLAIEVYAAAGLVFAVPFVLRGAGRIDPVAREGTVGFRLIILPGAVALWPWLLRRWLRGGPPPAERNAHRTAARASRTGEGA